MNNSLFLFVDIKNTFYLRKNVLKYITIAKILGIVSVELSLTIPMSIKYESIIICQIHCKKSLLGNFLSPLKEFIKFAARKVFWAIFFHL